MSRAKERALVAYPPEYGDEDFDKTWDSNEQYRDPYQEGYEQAEKDTIERTESHFESVLPNFLDMDTVKWLIKDFKKAMEEE